MIHAHRQGYVLVMAMLFMALLTTIGTRMYLQSVSFMERASFVERQQRASVLATSGVAYVQAQLSDCLRVEEDKEKPAEDQKKAKITPEMKVLQYLLPRLGVWQSISSPTPEDQQLPDESISMYLAVEQGKCAVNQLFSSVKKQDKADGLDVDTSQKAEADQQKRTDERQDALSSSSPRVQFGARIDEFIKADLFDQIESDVYKKRYTPLNEVTEIGVLKNAEYFKQRWFMPREPNKDDAYLTDLFSIWSDAKGLDPWYLSSSICTLLGIKRTTTFEAKQLSALVQQYKSSISVASVWDTIFKQVYGAEYAAVKNAASLFAQQLTMPIVNVLIDARVGSASAKLFVILEPFDAEYRIRKCYLL